MRKLSPRLPICHKPNQIFFLSLTLLLENLNSNSQGGPQRGGGGEVFQNCSFAKRQCVAHMFNHGWWRLAVGGWWRLVAVRGGWWLAIGGWWGLVVGGWRLVAVGNGWRLADGGGWRLAAGDPWGRSFRAVLSKKKLGSLRTTLVIPHFALWYWSHRSHQNANHSVRYDRERTLPTWHPQLGPPSLSLRLKTLGLGTAHVNAKNG